MPRRPHLGTEVKIFDPRDPATGTGGSELVDASVVRRGDQWRMYIAGQAEGYGRPTSTAHHFPKESHCRRAVGQLVATTPENCYRWLGCSEQGMGWRRDGTPHPM